jgi:very-short-patch-repair endonuclease
MNKTPRIRELRRQSTDAERTLWRRLRSRQFAGHKFRRQHPIGSFIFDFACLERNLIVEIDGGQYAANLERDAERTLWLEVEGYRVLRFWNNDITDNLDGVLSAIERSLAEG